MRRGGPLIPTDRCSITRACLSLLVPSCRALSALIPASRSPHWQTALQMGSWGHDRNQPALQRGDDGNYLAAAGLRHASAWMVQSVRIARDGARCSTATGLSTSRSSIPAAACASARGPTCSYQGPCNLRPNAGADPRAQAASRAGKDKLGGRFPVPHQVHFDSQQLQVAEPRVSWTSMMAKLRIYLAQARHKAARLVHHDWSVCSH